MFLFLGVGGEEGSRQSPVSHHMWSWHGVLLVWLIPRSKAVDVAARRDRGSFASHGNVPERGYVG